MFYFVCTSQLCVIYVGQDKGVSANCWTDCHQVMIIFIEHSGWLNDLSSQCQRESNEWSKCFVFAKTSYFQVHYRFHLSSFSLLWWSRPTGQTQMILSVQSNMNSSRVHLLLLSNWCTCACHQEWMLGLNLWNEANILHIAELFLHNCHADKVIDSN